MGENETVVICTYSAEWPGQFAAERLLLEPLLPGVIIEHIGSTAVPGLAAKPIIDIIVGVTTIEDFEYRIGSLANLGYEYFPQYERRLPQRRFFVKSVDQRRAFHIHAVVKGTTFWREHIAFRDALLADPRLTQQYAALKRQLSEQYRDDREAYTDAKAPFIRAVLATMRPSTEMG